MLSIRQLVQLVLLRQQSRRAIKLILQEEVIRIVVVIAVMVFQGRAGSEDLSIKNTVEMEMMRPLIIPHVSCLSSL